MPITPWIVVSIAFILKIICGRILENMAADCSGVIIKPVAFRYKFIAMLFAFEFCALAFTYSFHWAWKGSKKEVTEGEGRNEGEGGTVV